VTLVALVQRLLPSPGRQSDAHFHRQPLSAGTWTWKHVGKMVALNALRMGVDVVEDVLGGGRGLKESIKRLVPDGIKRMAQSVMGQFGSGVKKRKRRKVCTDVNDIFA